MRSSVPPVQRRPSADSCAHSLDAPASAESSLDDSTYDAHKSGAAAGADGGAAAAEPAQQAQQAQQQQAAAPREGTPHEGSTSTSPPASPRSRQQRQQHQQHGRGETGFDRLVSRVFSNESSEGSRSSRRGESGKAGGQAARWQGKLSGSYVRRALSARFGGRMEGSAEGKDAEAAAVAPPPGKSGERRRGGSLQRQAQASALHVLPTAGWGVLTPVLPCRRPPECGRRQGGGLGLLVRVRALCCAHGPGRRVPHRR